MPVCYKEQNRTLLKSKILLDKNWKVLNYFLQGEALDAFVSPETLDGNNQVCFFIAVRSCNNDELTFPRPRLLSGNAVPCIFEGSHNLPSSLFRA